MIKNKIFCALSTVAMVLSVASLSSTSASAGSVERRDEVVSDVEDFGSEFELGSPEAGRITAAGASAMTASIVTAVAVGIITSISSFIFLMQRRDN